jgi:hypothetical protein
MPDLTSFYGIRETTARLLSSEQNSQINKLPLCERNGSYQIRIYSYRYNQHEREEIHMRKVTIICVLIGMR